MSKILIVGGGVFGLSTAYALGSTGDDDIVLIDRSPTPPSVDAASSDLNKVIREDYDSAIYSALASESVAAWREPPFAPHYHECGYMMLAKESRGKAFIEKAIASHDPSSKTGPKPVIGNAAISEQINAPNAFTSATSDEYVSTFNTAGGWGAASDACEALRKHVLEKTKVKIQQGEVVKLVIEENDAKGVELVDGSKVKADIVVLCCGAWINVLLPAHIQRPKLQATAQILATINLSEEQAARYRKMPVLLSPDDGFYLFPPNKDNIFKCAFHSVGYVNYGQSTSDPAESVTAPRTKTYGGKQDDQAPAEGIQRLRKALARWLPELAAMDFTSTRLCHYADTADDNWIMDYSSEYPSLFIASGDSGHAFKFLPTIGKYIAQGIRRELSPELKDLWSITRERVSGRRDEPRPLLMEVGLGRAEDLKV